MRSIYRVRQSKFHPLITLRGKNWTAAAPCIDSDFLPDRRFFVQNLSVFQISMFNNELILWHSERIFAFSQIYVNIQCFNVSQMISRKLLRQKNTTTWVTRYLLSIRPNWFFPNNISEIYMRKLFFFLKLSCPLQYSFFRT